MNKAVAEIIGWYGMVATLLAYALVTTEILPPSNLFYLLLNITGALGLTVIAFFDKSTQLLLLNGTWALIALWGIYHYFTV
jgi:hypothetical protein